MSVDIETAYAEHNQVAVVVASRQPGLMPLMPPTVLLMAKAHLATALDLTILAIRRKLGTSDDELKSDWRIPQRSGLLVPTQELGQAVFDSARFQAIKYPSAKGGKHACLVVFPDRLGTTAFVEAYDPDHSTTASAAAATTLPHLCRFNLNGRLP